MSQFTLVPGSQTNSGGRHFAVPPSPFYPRVDPGTPTAVTPSDQAVDTTPTPGGATAGGVAPVARVDVGPGGAIAGGTQPSPGSTPAPGGAIAGGTSPTIRVAVTIGGALAGGPSPTARVPVGPGGATAGGTGPTSGGGDAVPAGGATAGGVGPSPAVTVSAGGALAGGTTPTVRVSITPGGATAGGITPTVPAPAGVPTIALLPPDPYDRDLTSLSGKLRFMVGSFTFSGSYTSGGEPLALPPVVQKVELFQMAPRGGYVFTYETTGKVKAWQAPASAGALVQVGAGTDLSALGALPFALFVR